MTSLNDERLIPGAGEPAKPGMLAGTRVIEFADELGEYTGLVLAGLGADVIKVELPGGSRTRALGPFLDDKPDAERSLYFWNYNRGKRSVALDLETEAGRAALLDLLAGADILLDTSCGELNQALGLDRAALQARFPALIIGRVTPFGDTGPWKDFKGSDLVHLALGGVMSNCGYDPAPGDRYDLAPIAPQVWHAYHIAGDQLAVGISAALLHRLRTGEGQEVSVAVHEAVAKNTELDLMSWVMRRAPLYRMTCRHAGEVPSRVPSIGHTKDGRWFMTYLGGPKDEVALVGFLEKYGMQADLERPPEGANLSARAIPGSSTGDERRAHIFEVMQRFIRAFRYDEMPWQEAQAAGLLWAPLRKPHENAQDPHWLMRGTFADVEHPEIGRSFRYVTSKWLSTATSWQVGRRAPLLGEHTQEVLAEPARVPAQPKTPRPDAPKPLLSPRGKPFPLQNIRIFDFSWFLASAGGTRYLAALGAESIKVEWKANPDTRLAAMAPVGGREAREKATAPLVGVKDADMGGQFNNKNSGKRGLSLNIRHPKGLQIARDLIRQSDIVAEGFSPGVLQRLGLGYDELRKIRPDIIYIQQSGMGSQGTYGRLRTVGPVAASFAGTSDMSGLPEPAMPVGWGYSYLDWMGAYSFALAILGALHHRERTGEGQWIDASQTETGIYLAGKAVLDWSANGRSFSRYGNRSPYKPAAPHGAYRCQGEDRWLAIACFDDAEWRALAKVAGHAEWLSDGRFATLQGRLAHQDELDALVTAWSQTQDAYETMMKLQAAGVAAGVSQTAADRYDRDPQLAELQWLTEVTGTKIGRWPVIEVPTKMTATPPYAGGPIDRGAPGYGEDNERILMEMLGLSREEVLRLAEEGII
ncbi:crotonobetainyl-CoA:carnitine CoA-transferase CaiB-like acyl-CoA transferase [Stella humosa]|uniref:Crotonobetainyl-CoA:carnitine CoA-transferase CaiB-like acyl-CoA transferase n=1 Tax=Stella humosa TaxID=94 RepID=A0A3N1M319_9PROT|nr:CoA transferase [Stella humosa]ROQ01944.1 crotonobetainyl-CoA:carnitine CoA-transferase CaiB-like acyl-CoA transferase [Stella humosa]